MGFSEYQLRKHCPELCKMVAERHMKSFIAYREKVRNKQAEEIRNVILGFAQHLK